MGRRRPIAPHNENESKAHKV